MCVWVYGCMGAWVFALAFSLSCLSPADIIMPLVFLPHSPQRAYKCDYTKGVRSDFTGMGGD